MQYSDKMVNYDYKLSVNDKINQIWKIYKFDGGSKMIAFGL